MDDALLATTPRTNNNNTRGIGTGVVGLYYLRQCIAVPLHLLSWPISLVYNLSLVVLGFVARLLGFRLSTSTFHPRNPFSPRGGGGGATGRRGGGGSRRSSRRSIVSPTAASQEWVDSVQRLVNLSINPHNTSQTSQIEIATSNGRLSSRRNNNAVVEASLELPEFFIGGYEQALKKARDEFQILMVILTCCENDHDQQFKLKVLTDSELLKVLKNEKVIVWGGDVVENRDAYKVGRTLAYTSLPFVAFIALQPTTSSSTSTSSSSSPRLSLISRIEPDPTTLPEISASHLHTHFHSIVLPKTRNYLNKLLQDRQRREREKFLRDERETRENLIAKRDEERILKLRREIDLKKRQELKKLEKDEIERLEQTKRIARVRLARKWRVSKRRQFEQEQATDGVRVVVRLGNGKRVMRRFDKSQEIVKVYEWVECELGREEDDQQQQQHEEDLLFEEEEEAYVQRFAFKLATTFPRQVIQLPISLFESANSRASFDSLKQGQQEGSRMEMQTVGEAFEGIGKDVMVKSIDAVLSRGERIEILVDRTDEMSQQARAFRKRSTVLR